MRRVRGSRYVAVVAVMAAVGATVLMWPVVGLGGVANPDQAQLGNPAPDPAGPPDRQSVLVHFDPAVKRGAAERENVGAFAAQRGGQVKYDYGTVLPNVINVRGIQDADIAALSKLPGVVRVEKDEYHPNVLMLHDSMPLIRALQSQITGAGYSADGAGVRICIVDTGIDSDHIMYADRIDTDAGYDFYNDDNDPEDDNGHGSHCAGIALGRTGLSVDFGCGAGDQAFQGVAPEATLIGAKVLNRFGGGYDSDIIAGINYCADQSASGAQADVISMSIGTGSYSGPCTHSWAVAANNAAANGVVAIAASGNNDYSNALSSPACGVDVISVGMTWKNDYPTCEDPYADWSWQVGCTDYSPQTDEVGCFSNESDYLDVTAPGANIWSADYSDSQGVGSTITGMSGTSMSCPTVAGLAALILNMDAALTPAEVRQIIRDGAIDMGPVGFDRAYGYGRIDVLDTLALVGSGCETNEDCDDDLYCNGAETCVDTVCQPGTPVVCNDGVDCTDDSCNETTDSCDYVPNNANCDDGVGCTDDTCDAVADCQFTANDANCNDGVGCTDDTCDAVSDCQFTPNDAYCPDNGLFCDGTEFCDAVNDCDSTGDPCGAGEVCNETTDTCDPSVCDNDGTCESGEDCNNCPNDCISGVGGAVCGNGLCEGGDGEDCRSCSADCNGRTTGAPSGRFCCGATEGCDDSRCTETGWDCTMVPQGTSYCCGDGTCEGAEDINNCAIDCGCTVPADCDDSNECTTDDCVGGVCENMPVADDTPCSGGICCGGTCDAAVCSIDGDCADSEACTTDTCYNGDTCSAYCDNVWPACGIADGCCGPTCDSSNDPDCEECLPRGEPCTEDSECCSLSCHPIKLTCK